jgi:uncharacterized glyoxalase superfamily protein PhnB
MSELTPWRIAPMLGVRDVNQAVEYYTSVLGFECPGGVFEGVAPGEGGVYAIVRRGDVEIHLQIRRRDLFAGKRESIEGDAYLFLPDVDALFAEFEAKGAKIHRPPEDAPYGLRDFVIEDAEGHRLTFGSPIS